MSKLVSRTSLLVFLYLNAGLGLVAAVSAAGAPDYVTFFAVGLPPVGVFVVAPFALWGRLVFPRGLIWASRLMFLPYILAVLSVMTGVGQLLPLSRGATVTGISVAEAPRHPEAVAFEFTDGHGLADGQGEAHETRYDSVGKYTVTWYVVPVVAPAWTAREPVPVWALHQDAIQPQVLSGQFRAGLRCDPAADRYRYARLAVRDAVQRRRLKSHPGAVILEMHESLAVYKSGAVVSLIFGLGLVNLFWGLAVLVSPPIQLRPAPAGEPESAGPTKALPLTPAMRECLRATMARAWRIAALPGGGIGLAIALAVGVIGALLSEPGKGPAGFGLGAAVGGAISLLLALLVTGALLLVGRKVRKDLRQGTFLRTTGPVRVAPFGMGKTAGFSLVLTDREFIVGTREAEGVAGLSWGTVDYTPHAHVIFEARDRADRVVYRDRLYNPGAAP